MMNSARIICGIIVCLVVSMMMVSIRAESSKKKGMEMSRIFKDGQKNDWKPIGYAWTFDVPAHTAHYYQLRNIPDIPEAEWLCLTASVVSGDCDLFVSSTVTEPSRQNCEANPDSCLSSTSAHNDIVCMNKNNPQFAHNLFIGMQCDAQSRYLFNAYFEDKTIVRLERTEDLPEVYVGAGQIAAVKRQNSYLRFSYDHIHNTGLQIAVSPTLGDPDVYVAWGADDLQVDNEHHTWSSRHYGGDVITINPDDPNYHWKDQTEGMRYQIAVKTFTPEAMFSISAFPHDGYDQLLEAVPTIGYVKKDDFEYYAFYLAEETATDLIIKIDPTTRNSDPDIFVTRDISAERPGPNNAQWRAQGTGSEQVKIDNAVQGYYYIAVKGFTDSSYTITGFTEFYNLVLQDGRPYNYEIQPGENNIQYFKYYHGDSDSGLTLQVTNNRPETGGALTMLMSQTDTRPLPHPGKYDHKGIKIGNKAVIHFQKLNVGPYYIGVMNDHDATAYTISATSEHSTIQLEDGHPILFQHVPKNYYRHYSFDIGANPNNNLIMVTANPSIGDVDVYVSTTIQQPTKESCTGTTCWKSETIDSDSVVINPANTQIPIQGSKFYIGVLGYTDAQFDILGHLSGSSVPIHDGDKISSAVVRDHYVYYKFKLGNGGTNRQVRIELQVADESQDVDIYVSSNTDYPDKTFCEDSGMCLKATRIGSDVVDIEAAKSDLTYNIGIYGVNSGSDTPRPFTLYVRSFYHRVDANRQGIVEYTKEGGLQPIRTMLFAHCEWAIISATLLSGNIDMYANIGLSPANKTNNQYKSLEWPGNVIVIPKGDLPQENTQVPVSIGIEAEEHSDYIVSSSCGNSFQHAEMTPGLPRLSAAIDGVYMYYRIYLQGIVGDPQDADWLINIHPSGGSIGVYVDQTNWKPTMESDHLIGSEGAESRVLRILSTGEKAIKTGYLYVGVKGIGETSTFTMTITKVGEPSFLTVDQPQRVHFNSNFTEDYFEILNSKHDYPFTLVLSSCQDVQAPQFFGSRTEQKPNKDNKDYESNEYQNNQYNQYMNIDWSNTATKYYFGIQQPSSEVVGDYSLVSFYDTAIPVVNNREITGKLENKKVVLRFPKAEPNPRFPDRTLQYKVYYSPLDISQGTPSPKNMDTVCAVTQSIESGLGIVKDDHVQHVMESIDLNGAYKVNVIVSDGKGMSNIYTPVFVNSGFVTKTFEPVCFKKLKSDSSVCSGRGTCDRRDHCSCTVKGWTGSFCQSAICYGVPASDPQVCSGVGQCTQPDKCQCNSKFKGDRCEIKKSSPVNPAAIIIPLLFVGFCCVVFVVIVIGAVVAGLLIYKKKSTMTYESFEDDADVSDMEYLDKKAKGEDQTAYEEL